MDLDLTGSNCGEVKPMTLKMILVASYLARGSALLEYSKEWFAQYQDNVWDIRSSGETSFSMEGQDYVRISWQLATLFCIRMCVFYEYTRRQRLTQASMSHLPAALSPAHIHMLN